MREISYISAPFFPFSRQTALQEGELLGGKGLSIHACRLFQFQKQLPVRLAIKTLLSSSGQLLQLIEDGFYEIRRIRPVSLAVYLEAIPSHFHSLPTKNITIRNADTLSNPEEAISRSGGRQ